MGVCPAKNKHGSSTTEVSKRNFFAWKQILDPMQGFVCTKTSTQRSLVHGHLARPELEPMHSYCCLTEPPAPPLFGARQQKRLTTARVAGSDSEPLAKGQPGRQPGRPETTRTGNDFGHRGIGTETLGLGVGNFHRPSRWALSSPRLGERGGPRG